MKLWKRNAVVAAIVLFVCVAVYLNWSYQEEGTETGKVLGQATLVNGATTDPLLAFRRAERCGQALHGLFCLGPPEPAAGPGQRAYHAAKYALCRRYGSGHAGCRRRH